MADDITFFKSLIAITASLLFVYTILSKLPNSTIKFIATIPIIFLFCKLPWLFSGLSLRTSSIIILTWLSNFKLILFCFDAGPLFPHRNNLPAFLLFAALPVLPKTSTPTAKTSISRVNHNWAQSMIVVIFAKLLVYVIVLIILFKFYSIKDTLHVHPLVVAIAYIAHVYVSIDGFLSIIVLIFQRGLGIELEPQFNHPYFSSSLGDFWGRRWNLVVAYTQRQAVYQPVRLVCRKIVDDEEIARSVAVFATFLVSGIMHEILLYSMLGVSPVGEWFAFFMLHAMLMLMENKLKVWLGRGGIVVPRVVSVFLTLVILFSSGMWLFFAPLVRHGFDEKSRSEVADIMDYWSSFMGASPKHA